MAIILKEKMHTAKKNYNCHACTVLTEYLNEINFTKKEKIIIEKARSNNWEIKAGEKYLCQVGVFSSDFYAIKSIPEINDICRKYELYDEE